MPSWVERCEKWLEERHGGKVFLTPSATSALEMAVMLMGIGRGDEVIMPSFGFASCPNSVILRGSTPIFVDIEEGTLSMDRDAAIQAITPNTRAFMPIHYAGVSKDYKFPWTIEDSAHCIGDFRVTGDFAAISFHETKNVSCGQGGCIIINNPEMIEKAQILRQCGTTKAIVKHGWDWVEVGTQQLMSEVLAEYLHIQLLKADEINARRKEVWHVYRDHIQGDEKASHEGNGHIFWFLARDRQRIVDSLNERGVRLATHYTPLHSRAPGIKHGRAFGSCETSTRIAAQILRPPMNVTPETARKIAEEINAVLAPVGVSG